MSLLNDLPVAFIERMKALPNFNFNEFITDYNKAPYRGLRVNMLRCTPEEFKEIAPFKLEPVPFCDEGFYIESDVSGKNPLHHAGVFYMQEPSAMSAVTALDVKPGMRVLDLCAAPGGKSTQAAAKLQGKGFILCNEIIPSRANILLSNIERCGIRNAAVTNEKPEKLCPRFEGYFDRVLVDAPCSGEGMFRREPAAAKEWTEGSATACATRQKGILDMACECVAEDGILVYSTCTFSPDEDEGVIDNFLKSHPDFEIVDIEKSFGEDAHPEWADADLSISKARRIFPKEGGEGHFVAKLHRISGGFSTVKAMAFKDVDKNIAQMFDDLYSSQFSEPLYGKLTSFADRLFIIPEGTPDLRGLDVLRTGVFAGRIKGKRIEPEHALFLAADRKTTLNAASFPLDSKEIMAFLHGEQIAAPEGTCKGYAAVKADDFIVGFGKVSEGVIKNHYPKGLRNL